MSHFLYEEWLKYVKGEIPEDTRALFENHLFNCEACLELYSEAISFHEDTLPDLSSSHFTDNVMRLIEKETGLSERIGETAAIDNKKKSFVQSVWFHYATAASFTLILTFSGVFQSMFGVLDKFENTAQAKESSITETVMNKTLSWLDEWEENNKEAKEK
ncbi:putative zinc finger protein [Bacillus oleivorans]|uniref:Putative zinc finger protein n=1 Tax=Bacillus oleivorans TaxID=1448271 RepID=A0A285CV63_9BACI|nr:zf-HC2 domain-containing protein [Bacillus oleivorans]SNX70928.1 putative zinc finger protein [Bacillus oleivorans]